MKSSRHDMRETRGHLTIAVRALALALALTLLPGMLLAGASIPALRALAEGGVMTMPRGLKAVDSQAFYGDGYLKDVVFQEGATNIGSLAFANSSVANVYLPTTLTNIAADAFDNCPNVIFHTDYFDEAFQYAEAHGIPCEVGCDGRYLIENVTYEGGQLYATLTTDESCQLVFYIIDEQNGKRSSAHRCPILGGNDSTSLPIASNISLPEHFEFEAILETPQENHLTRLYHTIQMTTRYERFSEETIEDYADRVTMDFGGGNYAVLAEDTVTVTGFKRVSEWEYDITTKTEPKIGDVLLLSSDSEEIPVRVKFVTKKGNNLYRIRDDEDATVSDLFDRYDLHVRLDNGNNAGYASNSTIFSAAINTSVTTGPVSASLSGSIKLDVDFVYDKKWFGEDYYEFSKTVKVEAEAKLECTEKYSSEEDTEIVLLDKPIYGIKGLGDVSVKISVPIGVEVDGGFSASGKYTAKVGVKFNTNEGKQPVNKSEFKPDIDASAGFEVKVVGLKLEASASLLKKLLKASLSGEVGVKIEGHVVNLSGSDLLDPERLIGLGDKIHACLVCIDGTAKLYGSVNFSISWEISERCKGNLVKVKLIGGEQDLWDFYISVINQSDSLFKGKPSMSFGKCPNCMYKTTIKTEDRQKQAVTGIPVTVEKSGSEVARGESALIAYLYPGDYIASATFGSIQYIQDFKITTGGKTVTVKEAIYTVDVSVTEENLTGSAIENADIAIRNAEGTVSARGYTRASGHYTVKLPAGEYTIAVTAHGYESSRLICTVSADTTLHVMLERRPYTVTFDPNGGTITSSGSRLRVRRGEAIGSLPSVSKEGYLFVEWNTKADGNGTKVTASTVPAGDMVVYAIWKADMMTSLLSDYPILHYGGHTYQISGYTSYFDDAEAACEAVGGHLCVMNSAGENHAVVDYLRSIGVGDSMIGLFDSAGSNGTWSTWVTGEPVTYSNWGYNQPDWTGQTICVVCPTANTTYGWEAEQWDNGWNGDYWFICEWDKIVNNT